MEMRRAIVAGIAAGVLAMGVACAPRGPGLEVWTGQEWIDAAPVVLRSLEGARRGQRVEARARLEGDGVEIELTFEVSVDPQARFEGGRYRWVIDGEAAEGPLAAESVEFLGGQNTAPSVGGVFVLGAIDDDRYRVRFPATPLD